MPRTAIKAKALADFIAEFTDQAGVGSNLDRDNVIREEEEAESSDHDPPIPSEAWILYVDGSSSSAGCGAGLILVGPEGYKTCYALRFDFRATNNEAEYEALLAGLSLARELGADPLEIRSDSLLIVNQVGGSFEAKDERMAKYLGKAKEALKNFKSWCIRRIPRADNAEADALARLASSRDGEGLVSIPIEHLCRSSIEDKDEHIQITDRARSWMDPISEYLGQGILPSDPEEARRTKNMSARYTLIDGKLYKRGFSMPYQRCVDQAEARYLLEEIHEGTCGNHSGGRALSLKCLRQGYFWPTMEKDAAEYTKKCVKCQQFSRLIKTHPEPLNSVVSSWPFAKWALDLVSLPPARAQFKFCIVAIDYLTKWVEVEPLAQKTEPKCTGFLWKNIICRFGVPHTVVTDNGKEFDNPSLTALCDRLGIKKVYSSPGYPQSNGQVEAVNKTIKETLKKKLDNLKGAWIDELHQVVWAYRTTSRTATGETPFAMAFGVEAVIPAEVGLPGLRVDGYDENSNEDRRRAELDLVEEKRDRAIVRTAARNQIVARYYNKRFKPRRFKVGDLVLKKVLVQQPGLGSFGPKWDGPYRVVSIVRPGTYKIADLDGRVLGHPWNADHLKIFFQ